jgi:hypothetical protein
MRNIAWSEVPQTRASQRLEVIEEKKLWRRKISEGREGRGDLAEDVIHHIRDECSASGVDGELVVSVVTVPHRRVGEGLNDGERGMEGGGGGDLRDALKGWEGQVLSLPRGELEQPLDLLVRVGSLALRLEELREEGALGQQIALRHAVRS